MQRFTVAWGVLQAPLSVMLIAGLVIAVPGRTYEVLRETLIANTLPRRLSLLLSVVRSAASTWATIAPHLEKAIKGFEDQNGIVTVHKPPSIDDETFQKLTGAAY